MTEQPYEYSSQGLGTAPALANVDLTDEVVEQRNPNDVAVELPRYIVLVGNMLTASQITERPDLRLGGEYLGSNYKTLVRSRGMLRRCQITPMEPAADFMSSDLMGDKPGGMVVTSQNYDGYQVNGIRVNPGDEIAGLLNVQRQQANAKGILEIEQLRGVEFAEFKKSGLQEFMFPEWQKIVAGYANLPNKHSKMVEHLESRKKATSDSSIKGVVDVYLQSAEQFYRWGQNYLKKSSTLVRMPAQGGEVYTYSELAEYLFDYLDIRREDMLSKESDLTDIIARANAGNVSSGEVATAIAKMTELMSVLVSNQAPAPVVAVPAIPTGEELRDPVTDSVPDSSFTVGEAVTLLDGRTGTVHSKPFGRLKVAFEDGTTEMVEKENVAG